MHDLLNTLQEIKDQTHPTLTQLVYERHHYMVILDAVVVLLLLIASIWLIVGTFTRTSVPLIVIIGCIGLVVCLASLHSTYRYEMTVESEQRVNNALANMPIDEYNNLVKQVKLADLNQIDDVMLHLIAKHVKNINTSRLRYR